MADEYSVNVGLTIGQRMFEAISAAAALNKRTLAEEIIHRLEVSRANDAWNAQQQVGVTQAGGLNQNAAIYSGLGKPVTAITR